MSIRLLAVHKKALRRRGLILKCGVCPPVPYKLDRDPAEVV